MRQWKVANPIRWNNGVLEQMWIVHEWDRYDNSWSNTSVYEWRPVPQAENVDSDVIYWWKNDA